MRLRRAQNHRFSLYHLSHVLATHGSCDQLVHAARGSEGGRRESSMLTFGTFGHAKVRYKKSISMFLYGGSKPYPVSATPTAFASQIGQFPPYAQSPSIANRQSKKYILHSVRALTLSTPALHFQRACRQCVHESARLFRVICSHAW